tara:strand:+ start:413 stop:595 length:183 start_codon:yes stop_codon:yes gene_type:complete
MNLNIKNAKYINNPFTSKKESIKVTIDGETVFVPLDLDNRHYAEILKQVAEGTLTIEDAD